MKHEKIKLKRNILYFLYVVIIVLSFFAVLNEHYDTMCLPSISDSLFVDENLLGGVLMSAAVSLNVMKNTSLFPGLLIMLLAFLKHQPIHSYLMVIAVIILLYECYTYLKCLTLLLLTVGITMGIGLWLDGNITFGGENNNSSAITFGGENNNSSAITFGGENNNSSAIQCSNFWILEYVFFVLFFPLLIETYTMISLASNIFKLELKPHRSVIYT